jgi:uncharacterized membrane protein
MMKQYSFFSKLRIRASDFIARWIATWTFVFLYTGAMITWILLHIFGVLHVDSADFIKWNLLLSWFAGIQASVIMISTNRKSEHEYETVLKGLELDKEGIVWLKKIVGKVEGVSNKINKLEEIIKLIEEEEKKKHEDK